MIHNSIVLCPRCLNFIKATENECRCGYQPCDEHGMLLE